MMLRKDCYVVRQLCECVFEYKIRVLAGDGSVSIETMEEHLNEHAAVRSAKRWAEDGDFEVWLEEAKIYVSSRYRQSRN